MALPNSLSRLWQRARSWCQGRGIISTARLPESLQSWAETIVGEYLWYGVAGPCIIPRKSGHQTPQTEHPLTEFLCSELAVAKATGLGHPHLGRSFKCLVCHPHLRVFFAPL